MFADYNGCKYNGFGENIFKKITRAVTKAPVKVIKRASAITVGTTKALVKGDIKTAGRNLMTLANPVSAVASVSTSNKKILDIARMSMPTSVVAIEDKDLRKKAAIGYVAAAAIATGIAAAQGVGTGLTSAAPVAGTAKPVADSTGLLASTAKLAKDAKTATDLAMIGKGLINKEKEPQERAGVEYTTDLIEKEIKHGGNIVTYSIVGVSILGILGVGYYLYKSREV